MNFKIKSQSQTMCISCRSGVITRRTRGSDLSYCKTFGTFVNGAVYECTGYEEANRPGQDQWELEKIAWILDDVKKGAKVVRGFTSPAERRKQTGTARIDVDID